jgi:glutaminase
MGPDKARDWLGVNATGLAFNSLAAVKRSADGRTDPMVNVGAKEKGKFIHSGRLHLLGRPSPLNAEIYASDTNFRHRSIARLLQSSIGSTVTQ